MILGCLIVYSEYMIIILRNISRKIFEGNA